MQIGIGDDAALLRGGVVVTTDAYADGVHFDLSYMTLRQVGERCACGAISDVVAMAAEPEAVFVALALPLARPRRLPRGRPAAQPPSMEAQVRQLYSGIDGVCRAMGCEVAGGDIIVVDRLLLALTVTGRARRPKLRSGARAGDGLYVTGHLGSAEAGRMVLADCVEKRTEEALVPTGARRLAKSDWRLPLVARHLRPLPRLAAMRTLRSSIHGLIDTSDGLATDARHICEMSGMRIVLEANTLPMLPATKRFCAGRGFDPIDFVLGAGEDYELLFTCRSEVPDSVRGVKVTRIGTIQAGDGLWITRDGRTLPVTVSGYDHIRAGRRGKTCS